MQCCSVTPLKSILDHYSHSLGVIKATLLIKNNIEYYYKYTHGKLKFTERMVIICACKKAWIQEMHETKREEGRRKQMLAVQHACRWAATATSYVNARQSLDRTHHKPQCNEIWWDARRGEERRVGVCAEQVRGEDKTGREKRGARSGGEESREVARIEQVCREEIRVLQVSLQDWYIDLRERERDRAAWWERVSLPWTQCFEYNF